MYQKAGSRQPRHTIGNRGMHVGAAPVLSDEEHVADVGDGPVAIRPADVLQEPRKPKRVRQPLWVARELHGCGIRQELPLARDRPLQNAGEKDASESDQPQRRSGKDVNENQQPHSRTTALGRTAAPTAPVTRTIFLVVFDPE